VKQFLKHRSRKQGYDGWALMVKGAKSPMGWTVSTTRKEIREVKKTEGAWIRPDIEIVKVKIEVTLA
jgi:hypothetical protein